MLSSRDVKEALVLGNALKGNWSDYEAFKTMLRHQKARIASLSDLALNDLIQDKKRLLAYDTATLWTLEEVRLSKCRVWPHMGGRKFITGSVEEAAALFLQHGKTDDRLYSMAKMAEADLFSELPIILFRRKKSPEGFRIDDGCNRAVAIWLVGIRVVNAYVGTVRADLNHSW